MKNIKFLILALPLFLAVTSCTDSDEIFEVIGDDGGGSNIPGGGDDINTYNLKTLQSDINVSTLFNFFGNDITMVNNVMALSEIDENGTLIASSFQIELIDPMTGTSITQNYVGDITYNGNLVSSISYGSQSPGDFSSTEYSYDSEDRLSQIAITETTDTGEDFIVINTISYPNASTVIIDGSSPETAFTITLTLSNGELTKRKIQFADSGNIYEANINTSGGNITSVEHFENGSSLGVLNFSYDTQINPIKPLFAQFGFFYKYPIGSMSGIKEEDYRNNPNVDIESIVLYHSENNITNSYYANISTSGIPSFNSYPFNNTYSGTDLTQRSGAYTATIDIPEFSLQGTVSTNRVESYTYY